MKNITISFGVLLLILLSQNVIGQFTFASKFGVNIANVRNTSAYNYSILFHYNTGIIAKYDLLSKFLLTTEILLSNKGYSELIIPNGTTTNKLTYLSVPILTEYKASKNVYFQLGPEINYLIAAQQKNDDLKKSIYEKYKKLDIAIAGGLGFKLSKSIALETRYTRGLTQIVNTNRYFETFKTNTLQLNFVYQFTNTKK